MAPTRLISADSHVAISQDRVKAHLAPLWHDEYDAAQDESDFPLRVVLGDSAPIEATAHFRGQSSLDCDRKNYNINMAGDMPRRLMPGSASDEFHLVSMCNERYYFRHVLATRMMRALGLFPLRQRYVRLVVAGGRGDG